jgi:hypothetical protein
LQDLLAETVVLERAARRRSVLEDAGSVSRGFLETYGLGDIGIENVFTENFDDLFAHLAGKDRSSIEHRDQDPQHPKFGVWAGFDLVDRLQ